MRICMVGAGYVGLVSSACFADFGWTVACVDRDLERIAALQRGKVPIYEPGLDALLERNMHAGRLRFSTLLSKDVPRTDVVFLAVGTPMRRGNGYADLSYIYEAVSEIAPHLDSTAVVVTKSTVPVGTSSGKSNGDFVNLGRMPKSPFAPIPNFCVRAPLYMILPILTAC